MGEGSVLFLARICQISYSFSGHTADRTAKTKKVNNLTVFELDLKVANVHSATSLPDVGTAFPFPNINTALSNVGTDLPAIDDDEAFPAAVVLTPHPDRPLSDRPLSDRPHQGLPRHVMVLFCR